MQSKNTRRESDRIIVLCRVLTANLFTYILNSRCSLSIDIHTKTCSHEFRCMATGEARSLIYVHYIRNIESTINITIYSLTSRAYV